jgi:hypothetical protein
MLISDPQKLTATDLKVQRAACWILGMHVAFRMRGYPKKFIKTQADRDAFHAQVNTALELIKHGVTSRGPLVLYDLIAYVNTYAPRFHPPLWPEERPS